MPAKSRSQQRLMGMVHAEKKGKLKTKGMDPDLKKKVKKIASGIKGKDAEKFAKTKHKGLPEKVKENKLPTFKEFLVEITQKERQMLTPHPAVVKLYNQLKKKHGMVKRDTFFNAAIDRFNLSVPGLKKFASHPAIRALPFDDVSQTDKPLVAPRDPWAHVTQKFAKREDRAKRAGLNMESINENVHADLILSWIDANDGSFDEWYVSDRGDTIVFYEPPEFEDEGMDKLIVHRSDVKLSDWKKLKTLAKQLPKY